MSPLRDSGKHNITNFTFKIAHDSNILCIQGRIPLFCETDETYIIIFTYIPWSTFAYLQGSYTIQPGAKMW